MHIHGLHAVVSSRNFRHGAYYLQLDQKGLRYTFILQIKDYLLFTFVFNQAHVCDCLHSVIRITLQEPW